MDGQSEEDREKKGRQQYAQRRRRTITKGGREGRTVVINTERSAAPPLSHDPEWSIAGRMEGTSETKRDE